MTSQIFGPKTCLTQGPECPFRCLDEVRMMEYHSIQCCCIISLSFSEKEEFGMSVSIHSTLIPDTEWVLNDEKTVKWQWNEEEKNLRGWPLFKILPRGSVYPSFKIGFIQSKVTISWSLVGGIRFFLIYSHQKWWNESGMGVKKSKSLKNISHSFLIQWVKK